jgi:predicted membrane-bound dolichyl-phosphate-mannose-protein mannosyltransferase
LVTTDAGQTCFLQALIYAFYRYVKAPSARRLVITGLAVGLALASKHSAALVIPMLVILALVELFRERKSPATKPQRSVGKRALRYAASLLVIYVIAVAILWAAYGFRYSARENGLQLNPSMHAQLARVPSPIQANVLGEFAELHLLPESYICGFAHVLFSAKNFKWATTPANFLKYCVVCHT